MMMVVFVLINWYVMCEQDVIPLLQQQLIDQFNNPQLLYNAGVAAQQASDLTQAANYFMQACDYKEQLSDESYFKTRYNLGNVQAQQKEYDAALITFKQLAQEHPEDERIRKKIEYLEQLKNQQEQQQSEQTQKPEQSQDDGKTDSDKQSQGSDRQRQEQQDSSGQQNTRNNEQSDQGESNPQHQAQEKEQQARDKTQSEKSKSEHAEERKQQSNHSSTSRQESSQRNEQIQSTTKKGDSRAEQYIEALLDYEKQHTKQMLKAQTAAMRSHDQLKNW